MSSCCFLSPFCLALSRCLQGARPRANKRRTSSSCVLSCLSACLICLVDVVMGTLAGTIRVCSPAPPFFFRCGNALSCRTWVRCVPSRQDGKEGRRGRAVFLSPPCLITPFIQPLQKLFPHQFRVVRPEKPRCSSKRIDVCDGCLTG